jgi:hypothetical protein
MKRTNRSEGRELQVLNADELHHVIGGTDDPSKPIGDPGESGGSGSGDMDAVAQLFSGRR